MGNKNKKKSLPDNKVATQRNDLIHSQQSLTLVQKRIFALALQQIKRGDKDFKSYIIEISKLVDTGTSSDIFSRAEKELDSLMDKKLFRKEEIEGEDHPDTTRWNIVSKARHSHSKGQIEIDLHPDIRDMLLELKGNYTPLPVAQILSCKTTSGQRLYEILYCESWKGNIYEVSLEELRFKLNIENKYKNFSDFRRFILGRAQKDLKENTNMEFEWNAESRGKGKAITHITFSFNIRKDELNEDMQERLPKFEPKFNLVHRLTDNAELNKKQVNRVVRWLAENPGQQKPLGYWLHHKVECPNPIDSLGNLIRDMQAWAFDKIEKAMNTGGFPKPAEKPKARIDEKIFEKDIPESEPNNHFKDDYSYYFNDD